ncbi:hypothetical protein BYT27DRAFT_6830950 [Phlegmacium glaucopus]|nr:hypothetical protein BYT27DRAFT_6830950 [Phlegmacium glaucopus]
MERNGIVRSEIRLRFDSVLIQLYSKLISLCGIASKRVNRYCKRKEQEYLVESQIATANQKPRTLNGRVPPKLAYGDVGTVPRFCFLTVANQQHREYRRFFRDDALCYGDFL